MTVRKMPWNDKVLDNLEQIYWSPDKIGLRPIKRQPTPDGEGFFVPKERLAEGKSLYSRGQVYSEWRPAITKKEELLNQVLECKCWIKIPQKCWHKIPHLSGSAISRSVDEHLRFSGVGRGVSVAAAG